MSLRSIVREADPGPAVATLVLLHGLGADELDLLGIADYLDHPGVRVVSVRAPYRREFGGFSWFGIEIGEGELTIDAEEARESLEKVCQFLRETQGPILLGGFSQGAMMSLGVLLKQSDLIHGVVCMSGGLLPCFAPEVFEPRPIFMSHGRYDPLVPLDFGKSSAKTLYDMGCPVEFRTYAMDHGISEECLSDVSDWVHNWVKNLANSP